MELEIEARCKYVRLYPSISVLRPVVLKCVWEFLKTRLVWGKNIGLALIYSKIYIRYENRNQLGKPHIQEII